MFHVDLPEKLMFNGLSALGKIEGLLMPDKVSSEEERGRHTAIRSVWKMIKSLCCFLVSISN